jgi:very-short-patch-repair endonuclease
MQLPPTTFFTRLGIDEEEDQDLGVDEESILDLALGTFRPVRDLRWHYRSEHHSLIQFSNHHFYGDRLIVFPSPTKAPLTDMGVRYSYQQEALYQGSSGGVGRGGVNSDEARAVAEAAIEAMAERPTWSLGVAAVNRTQAQLIDDEVRLLSSRSSAARRFIDAREATLEPFFVKNLENVQGDERDHIIISTVYGPSSPSGPVHQHFGPISGADGHRRLNVLYTRARKRVDLYSSMTSADIKLTETSSRGVQALRGYLEYAATGGAEATVGGNGRQPESDFEVTVAKLLVNRGFDVDCQVGVSGYHLDLAVRHPEYPIGYIAGVECDGAIYASATSARDRDVLRQEILERLGWSVYRIWSIDWLASPDAEIDRLVSFLRAKLKAAKRVLQGQATGAAGTTSSFCGHLDSEEGRDAGVWQGTDRSD